MAFEKFSNCDLTHSGKFPRIEFPKIDFRKPIDFSRDANREASITAEITAQVNEVNRLDTSVAIDFSRPD